MTLKAWARPRRVLRAGSEPGSDLRSDMCRKIRTLALALAASLLAPVAAIAQAAVDSNAIAVRPVLMELFTAQGCAACPPADEMMLQLAEREDVIALALHVDYWDYIGWPDTFAQRAFTERQQRYARRHGHSTIYTPQVVVNGIEIVEGYRVMQVMDTLEAQRRRAPEIDLVLSRVEGGGLEIRARPLDSSPAVAALASRRSGIAVETANSVVGTLAIGAASAAPASAPTASTTAPFVVDLVRYRPLADVAILDGENAGRHGRYANIVTSWQTVGSWDMRAPLLISVAIEGDDPAVVIVQEVGQGEIVAAARLR